MQLGSLSNNSNQSSASSMMSNSVKQTVTETYLHSDMATQRKEILLLFLCYLIPVIKQLLEFMLFYYILGQNSLYVLITAFIVESIYFCSARLISTSVSKIVSKNIANGQTKIANTYLTVAFCIVIIFCSLTSIILFSLKDQFLHLFFTDITGIQLFIKIKVIAVIFTGCISQFMQAVLISIHRIFSCFVLVLTEMLITTLLLILGTLLLDQKYTSENTQILYLLSKSCGSAIPAAYYFTLIFPTSRKAFRLDFRSLLPFRPAVYLHIFKLIFNNVLIVSPKIITSVSLFCINKDYDGKLVTRKFYTQMSVYLFELVRQLSATYCDAVTDHVGFFVSNCAVNQQFDRIKLIYKEVIFVQGVIAFVYAFLVYLMAEPLLLLLLRYSRVEYDFSLYEDNLSQIDQTRFAAIPYLFSSGYAIFMSQQCFSSDRNTVVFILFMLFIDSMFYMKQLLLDRFGDFQIILFWIQLIKQILSYIMVYDVFDDVIAAGNSCKVNGSELKEIQHKFDENEQNQSNYFNVVDQDSTQQLIKNDIELQQSDILFSATEVDHKQSTISMNNESHQQFGVINKDALDQNYLQDGESVPLDD